jgi:methyltransferase-like protein/trans-aconitate methyltransferase
VATLGPNPHESYEEVPYKGQAFVQTHPDRLATQARIFGMNPAPVESCRVLELGCGDGGNLIPMALALPGSRFTGVDNAAGAVAEGEAALRELRLGNISLRCLDILEVPSDLGQFDYIIAHGVFSWVPPAVREKTLSLCHDLLAPQGVAYISYNAYPGGHLRETVREMMRFHVRAISEAESRVQQALALMGFLAQGHPKEDAYGALLREEQSSLAQRRPEGLYHDELAEFNTQFYFHEFIEGAARHGLQYLAEADYADMTDSVFAEPVTRALQQMGDLIVKEQYLDFLKGRRFRQTLLCHAEVALDRDLDAARFMQFYVACQARPATPESDEFRTDQGVTLTTNHPLARAALCELSEVWPAALAFREMAARAQARAQRDLAPEDLTFLGNLAWRGYSSGAIRLSVHPPAFATEVSARPVASPLARLQSRSGQVVTNLLQGSVRLEDDLTRRLVQMLDGTRDRAAVLDELAELAASGAVPLGNTGGRAEARRMLDEGLDQHMARLAKLALLTA